MALPNVFQTENPINANFDYNDIVSGQGYVTFYPTIAKDNTISFNILADKAYSGASSTGNISGNTYTYDFISSKFNNARRINGSVYLGSYVYQPLQVTASLYDIDFTNVSLGASIATNATDNTLPTGSGYQTMYTFSALNNYVYKVTVDAYFTGGGGGDGNVRAKFTYSDGNIAYATGGAASYVSQVFTLDNPYNNNLVTSIVIEGQRDGDVLHAVAKEVFTITGQIETLIAPAVISNYVAANGTFLIQINITNYLLAVDRRLKLRLYLSGVGTLTCDPLNSILTTQTLRLEVPFKIDI